ncbi:MAG: enoyl-CoA hydratase/isomerase family protein [Ectothiorhodospiraceae bacterium]|nr:enoyl-CoA hydratase/isomerase family protein [Ectothiorhodospiraceae bacterium]
MQLATDKMIARKADGIGWMIFNNPERRNAVSLAMREAMAQIFDAFRKDDEVRVLVMRGAGEKAFVSGADISEFEDKRNNADAAAVYAEASARATDAMQRFDKPLIAMIHGYCIGGGLGTALGADMRIASEDAQFAIPAAKLGLGYGFSALRQLTDVVGPAIASEILFTGRRMPASRALAVGLVNLVVPADQLEATVVEYASEIAANAPLTVKASKATIGQIRKDPSDRDVDRVETLIKACFDSEDYQEGRRAFMEKRKPQFRGR